MSTELVRYRRNPTDMVSSNSTAIIVGTVILAVLVLYFLLRNKTSTPAISTKQWKMTYNDDGMMTGIQMVDLSKI